MKKVSIIVPIFKAEKYIEKCARSLFEQTLDEIEYIFVDDCTPDNSIKVLQTVISDYPHRDKDARIIHNHRNLGAAGAKNMGLREATSEYIMFADSDDWLDLDGVEKMYTVITEKEADIVYSDYYGGYDTAEDNIVEEPECKDSVEAISFFLRGSLSGCMPFKIIKRSFLQKTDEWLIEGANVFEDLGWFIRLGVHNPKIIHAPFAFYHYIIDNPNSVLHTTRKEIKPIPDVLVNIRAAIKKIEDYGLANVLQEDILYAKAKARDSWLRSNIQDLKKWRNTFPESDSYVTQVPAPMSVKIAKWFLTKGFYTPMLLRLKLSEYISGK